MPSRLPFVTIAALLALTTTGLAQQRKPKPDDYVEPFVRTFKAGGHNRAAVVLVPKTARWRTSPVVFGFHGLGGTAMNAGKAFQIHEYWPEAIVVYPQGLTVTDLPAPVKGKSGWTIKGPDATNRDLLFFDTLLASLRSEYKVDDDRIFVMGHSFGGAMTYWLWAKRSTEIDAVCISGITPGLITDDPPESVTRLLEPMPAVVATGLKDPLLKPEVARRTIELLREVNQCEDPIPGPKRGIDVYPSRVGATLVAIQHPGGHGLPKGSGQAIVRFFKNKDVDPREVRR